MDWCSLCVEPLLTLLFHTLNEQSIVLVKPSNIIPIGCVVVIICSVVITLKLIDRTIFYCVNSIRAGDGNGNGNSDGNDNGDGNGNSDGNDMIMVMVMVIVMVMIMVMVW